MLRVEGLTKRFGGLVAVNGVSFEVPAGQVMSIVGPNGAGKTTLLSILAGLTPASAGSVDRSPTEVGWAPQQPAIYSKLSVAENLGLFAHLEGVEDPRAGVERMLDQTGLRERAGEAVSRLSGGNRQRVNVAIALIANPQVLALDEPSASLDPAQRERLWEFIAGLSGAGTAVLFSTHNASEAQRHADRVLVLVEGRLCFNGPPDELIATAGEEAEGDLERALVRFLAGVPAAEGEPPR
jgi:ABC-2 type transport system ATP-binding protein